MKSKAATPFTIRCYCGAISEEIAARPMTVAYCHCGDCKRWTGAPAPAFAAFPADAVPLARFGTSKSFVKGVDRWTCSVCHSPMAATFDYLPGQVYVPLGVLAPLEALAPEMHCHVGSAPTWLHTDDGLPRAESSARDMLNDAGE